MSREVPGTCEIQPTLDESYRPFGWFASTKAVSSSRHKNLLKSLCDWIKQSRQKRFNRFVPALRRKLTGFRNYFGLPDNSRSVSRVYDVVIAMLYKWLKKAQSATQL
ncbi:group II intron maturase-specific domain-containing protein [Marinimicrobium locisalis]|uniref:group II intron maturase-specific domain-containing protein n=1 Tax=Marinimicrobium locisalis TaxID=546022 RepID=UPI003D3004B4